jgi:transcriptional regulator with XRE-family HTH domain
MGRMKASPSGNEVNPLQRMLGTFLRLERVKLGYSTADVARRLGLTDTYLRLAESGRAALNQSLVFKIIAVFAASSDPTHDSRTISFNRFALFLVGTHWVGAEMGAGSSAYIATETLADNVTDFRLFCDLTKGYFDHAEGSSEQKQFLEEVAAPEVGSFLRLESYGQVSATQKDFLSIGDLPTLNIDILLDLKQSLTGRSFVHTDKIAAQWESERATQFKNFRALFSHAKHVVNSDNLDKFHYEYLIQRRFIEGKFLFIESDNDEHELKDKFVRLVNAGRKKTQVLNPMTQDEIDKVRFVCLSKIERRTYSDEIAALLNRENATLEAYWSFETHSGLEISFIGVEGDNFENIRNLSFGESERKSKLFGNLWDAINVAR